MPSIEGGGVEKNLFLISNYLSQNIKKIIFVTFLTNIKKINKRIIIIKPKFFNTVINSRIIKIILSCLLLFKVLKNNRNAVFLVS